MHGLRKFADGVLGESSPLFLSRLLSAGVTLWLPLVLVRLLTADAFGGYKQFFLVAQTALLIGQLGITQSLFYFLPRGRGGAYLVQAVLALSGLGLVLGVALFVSAPVLSQLLASPTLAQARLPLALCVWAMLASAPLEIALVAEQRVMAAAIAYGFSDALRALALTAVAALGDWQAMFWAATAVAWLRVGALGILLCRSVLATAMPAWTAWRAQLAFAIPFAGTGILSVTQRYFAQYAVSSSFDPATFAIFTVASFHLFGVDVIFNPIADVLTVRLSRALRDSAQLTPAAQTSDTLVQWHLAVRRLAMLLLPLTAGSIALGHLIVPLLFTNAYASAVPLFALVSLQIPLFVLPVESLLWAAGDSRYLFRIGLARSAFSVVGVLAGIHWLGLPGAILGSLVPDMFSRLALLARGQRILQVRASAVVDWRALLRIGLAAVVAAVLAGVASLLPLRAALQLGTGVLVYGMAYLGTLGLLQRRRSSVLRIVS